MNCVVRLGLILFLIRHSFTYSYKDFVNLKRTLFENYTNDVRPVLNQSEPIHVYIDLWISSIQSFDEKHGILRTSLGFEFMWNDGMQAKRVMIILIFLNNMYGIQKCI